MSKPNFTKFWMNLEDYLIFYKEKIFFLDPGTKRIYYNKYLVLGYPLTEGMIS